MPETMELIEVNRDFAVVCKPFGWLSEKPAGGGDSVPGGLERILTERKLPYESVYCVHRLDRTTEGLMVYALTKAAAAKLSSLMQSGQFRKVYHAYLTADGALPAEGEMRDWLFFDRRADKSYVVTAGKKDAKEAALSYRIVGSVELTDAFGDSFTAEKAEVKLETGRSHQIRVQFGSRRSPLIGDGKYGSRVKYRGPALFSVRLSFPWKGKELVFEREEEIR